MKDSILCSMNPKGDSMSLTWKLVFVFLFLTINAEAYTQRKIELRVDESTVNEESLSIEILKPVDQEIVEIRYILNSIEDKEFKDHMKKSKTYINTEKITCFNIDRRLLHKGEYVLHAEVEHRKVRFFDWLKFFTLSETENIFLKINISEDPVNAE